MHYQRTRRHGDPFYLRPDRHFGSNDERFWSYVDKTSECWVWTGSHRKLRGGYGQFHVKHEDGTVSNVLAHRYSARLAGMNIEGLFVCHKCDNPVCVRPDHLFAGTHEDNMRDRDAKGRQHSLRGEDAASSILTEAKVREIRRLRAEDGTPYKVLAQMFGVATPTIGTVLARRSWKHVQ